MKKESSYYASVGYSNAALMKDGHLGMGRIQDVTILTEIDKKGI